MLKSAYADLEAKANQGRAMVVIAIVSRMSRIGWLCENRQDIPKWIAKTAGAHLAVQGRRLPAQSEADLLTYQFDDHKYSQPASKR